MFQSLETIHRYNQIFASSSTSREDLEIASLSSKMETMAFEFADMLKEQWRLSVGGDYSWDGLSMLND